MQQAASGPKIASDLFPPLIEQGGPLKTFTQRLASKLLNFVPAGHEHPSKTTTASDIGCRRNPSQASHEPGPHAGQFATYKKPRQGESFAQERAKEIGT